MPLKLPHEIDCHTKIRRPGQSAKRCILYVSFVDPQPADLGIVNSMSAMEYARRNKHPRMLTEAERDRLEEFIDSIHYSQR